MKLPGSILLPLALISAFCGTARGEEIPAAVAFLTRPMVFAGYNPQPADTFALEMPSSFVQLRAVMYPDTIFEASDSIITADVSSLAHIERMRYQYMLAHPGEIDFLAWKLPEPPMLRASEDNTQEYLVSDLPDLPEHEVPLMLIDDIRRTNWLHTFDGSVQFSQAYLSPNWYQGGNNNLTLLVGLSWDVSLNEVYYPNLLFTNSISYKLGLYSTPQDTYHSYGISEDLFQWNMKLGLRARNKWFYSFTTQFKTQFINNYGENSLVRKASFLSPGELNLGLGMTYSTKNKRGNFKFDVSMAPISYNLKTCIDRGVDPTQFSIPAGRKVYNQIGSSAELTALWNVTSNISWKSRLFIFTDYDDFQGDWENTIHFSINRFLSTQVYLHMRYDTASSSPSESWRYWMMKEILSFGFRYAFSSK